MAIYFWIQVLLIAIKHSSYMLAAKSDWVLVFALAFSVAVSLTLTILYLLFYPKDQKTYDFWYSIHYTGVLIAVYTFSFCYFATSISHSPSDYYVCYFIICVLLLMIVFVHQYERWPGCYFVVTVTSISFLGTLFLIDLIFDYNKLVFAVFYLPMFVLLFELGCAFLLVFFSVPEQCCNNKNRFTNLYLSSLVFFTIIWINIIFEAFVVLYHVIHLNSGIYDEDKDDWWQFSNIYH